MTMHLPKLLAATALAFVVGGASPVGAQVADHLKCYRVRDPIASVRYTANLQGLLPQPGCTVRARAAMLCVATTKTGVSPTPPGGGPSTPSPAGKFLCYRVKCARQTLPNQTLSDQFGGRTVTPRTTAMLCAPASPSGAFLDVADDLF
jgi:hypothetical protein